MTHEHHHDHLHAHVHAQAAWNASLPDERPGRILFFDCIGGVSGDMCLGALIDLGCPLDHLREQLAHLGLDEHFELSTESKQVHGIKATHACVRLVGPDVHGRHLPEIVEIIEKSGLPTTVVEMAIAVFHVLGEAEARVHGVAIDDIHFHEVGAIDAIVDIVGTCVAIDCFHPAAIHCTPLRTGTGFVKAGHGVLPVPAPAVLQLATGRTMEYIDHRGETTTPTGAAILRALAVEKPTLRLVVEGIGYGCGTRDVEAFPNVLRVVSGHLA